MKKGILLGVMMGVFVAVRAQTFSEWFFQKKTQINYLKKQIAALMAYDDQLQQGYDIARDGTDAITTVKQADLDLHSGYFTSLKSVNPVIRGSPEVEETIRLAEVVTEVAEQAGNAEAGVVTDCEEDIALLEMLITDGQLEMTDAERMKAIDVLYERMKRRCTAAIAVRNQIALLISNHSS